MGYYILCYPYPNPCLTRYSFKSSIKIRGYYSNKNMKKADSKKDWIWIFFISSYIPKYSSYSCKNDWPNTWHGRLWIDQLWLIKCNDSVHCYQTIWLNFMLYDYKFAHFKMLISLKKPSILKRSLSYQDLLDNAENCLN